MSDDTNNLPAKKQKVIQPLNADDPDLLQAHDDMLRELQKRTAELTAKVQGYEEKGTRTLELDKTEKDEQRIEALALQAPANSLPQPSTHVSESDNPAADLVRAKLKKLFDDVPDATTQAAESVATTEKHRSKHQEFMYELTTSGKSLAEVQTAWHNYYVALPDKEKHDVWREFYENQSAASAFANVEHRKEENRSHKEKRSTKRGKNPLKAAAHEHAKKLDESELKNRIKNKVSANGQLTAKDHFKSLAVGLGLTVIVGGLFMFTFFNQAIIAPFISPSRNVSATPILDSASEDVGPEPLIIIPKINVEVPVVYDINSIEEKAIQDALENGVVHYATTPYPGQRGNGVIVGHSSNNILNSGKYKFAFVLLRKLEIDDTFYLNYKGVRYTYKIYEKRVVPPTDTSVLGPANRDNSFTLITCDPPGTSTNRLIIVGEQVSPDPSSNEPATINLDEIEGSTEEIVPGNAPSLWSRLWPF